MSAHPDVTATIASLLHVADMMDAPAAFVAQLWAIQGCDYRTQVERLDVLRGEFASLNNEAIEREHAEAGPAVELAPVIPLFGAR